MEIKCSIASSVAIWHIGYTRDGGIEWVTCLQFFKQKCEESVSFSLEAKGT